MEPNHKPDRCIGCPLYNEAGPVWGFGPAEGPVDIVWLGEAPGADETGISGRPFTGGSGRLLTMLASKAGLNRLKHPVTNVVKCRPVARLPSGELVLGANGKPKDRAPTQDEIRHCAPFLAEEMARWKPNLVIALGASALYVYKDTNKIGKFRGVPFMAAGQKVLATYHPAALMRQQKMFPAVITDLQLAARESKSAELVQHEHRYYPLELAGRARPAILEAARRDGYAIVDWETTGLDPRTGDFKLAGFGTGPSTSYALVWSDDTERLCVEVLTDPTIEKVGQNSEDFDWRFWEEKRPDAKIQGPTFDTMLGAHLVNPDLPKNLEAITSYHAPWIQPWKGPQMYKGSIDDLAHGCCVDVDATRWCYLGIKRELGLLGLLDLYYKSIVPLQPVLRNMTRRGLRIDSEKSALWGMAMEDTANRKDAELKEALGEPYFNVASPTQLMELFYDKLGLPEQWITDRNGTRRTANAEAMETLAEITNDPVFHHVNNIRTLRKFKSTYCDVWRDDDNFTHPHFGCGKAANGRLNSWDFNAQNVPLDLREMWVPDTPEHVIISADWNQVEWRVAMALAGDLHGLEMFASGRDIHRTVSQGVTGTPYDLVSEDQRHQSKFVVYGWAYGRGAESIALKHDKTVQWAKDFIRGLERTFPEYNSMRLLWENLVAKQNYLRNPFGRRRWWYSRQVTEVYNFPPSSTAADMMYLVIPRVDSQLPSGASLRLTIHDELVVVAHRSCVKQATECLLDNMQMNFPSVTDASLRPERVRKFFPHGWWAPVEVSYGRNWKESKGKDKAAQHELRKLLEVA